MELDIDATGSHIPTASQDVLAILPVDILPGTALQQQRAHAPGVSGPLSSFLGAGGVEMDDVPTLDAIDMSNHQPILLTDPMDSRRPCHKAWLLAPISSSYVFGVSDGLKVPRVDTLPNPAQVVKLKVRRYVPNKD